TLSAVIGNVFLSYYNIRTNFPALVISIPNNVLYYFNFVSFDFFKESDGFSYVCLNTCPLILGVISLESPSSFVYQFFISNVIFYYEEIRFLILFYFIFFYKKYLNYVVGSGVYNIEDISLFLI